MARQSRTAKKAVTKKKKTKAKARTTKVGSGGRKRVAKKAGGAESERFRTILEQISPQFVERGARRIGPADVEQVFRAGAEVRRHFKRSAALGRFANEGEQMIAIIEDCSNGQYSDVTYWALAVMTFALQYVLKPVDIIPDSLPVIGELDDALVVSLAIGMVRPELQRHRIWHLARELEE